MYMGAIDRVVEEVFRREAGRVLATLIRLLGDFDLAEEARQEAFAAAIEQWAAAGVPANPCAWLIRAGRNKAVDRIRRDVVFRTKVQGREIASAEADAAAVSEDEDDSTFGDDRLRLIFTCCHPALGAEAHVALTLREVCGLTTQAVARAFLVSEETMAQRLVRAKKKIRDAGIPYETPEPPLLNQRIHGVLAVVYGVFTEGYAVTTGSRLVDAELCGEAIRLGRLLDELLPANPAVMGLLALMLLHDARRPARVSQDGDVILLENQDRTLWDQAKIAEGLALVDRALSTPGQVEPLCRSSGDRRLARAGAAQRGHGLAPDCRAVRGAAAAATESRHRTESRGSRLHGGRCGARTRSRRLAQGARTSQRVSLAPRGARAISAATRAPARGPRCLPLGVGPRHARA